MRVLAISGDEPEDSRAFAARLGIAHDTRGSTAAGSATEGQRGSIELLSDPDKAVARQYSGESTDDNAIPGVTIIDRDGRVVFRQVASAKDDRITTDELLAAIDRSLATTGPAAAGEGFAAIDRAQLRIDAGGGAADAHAAHASGTGAIAALWPLSPHFLVGPRLAYAPTSPLSASPVDAELELIARAPIWARAGALELGVAGGYTLAGDRGPAITARAGMWFAVSPSFGVQLGAELGHHDGETDALATIGLGWLVRVR